LLPLFRKNDSRALEYRVQKPRGRQDWEESRFFVPANTFLGITLEDPPGQELE
jgi:hypothetical protein